MIHSNIYYNSVENNYTITVMIKTEIQCIKLYWPLDICSFFFFFGNDGLVELKLCWTPEYLTSMSTGYGRIWFTNSTCSLKVSPFLAVHGGPCTILSSKGHLKFFSSGYDDLLWHPKRSTLWWKNKISESRLYPILVDIISFALQAF